MAINIGSPFKFEGEEFIDSRQRVSSLSDLKSWSTSIPPGFEVYVDSEKSWYIYDPGNTVSEETGKFRKRDLKSEKSIPIYGTSDLKNIDPSLLSDKYITIPDDDSLDGEVENQTYTTSGNGSYVDILFSAIRKLQSEVAKIKNTFTYGLNSYTDKNTAMSTVMATYPDETISSSEPLWAVEETDLSEIEGVSVLIGEGHGLSTTGDGKVNTDIENVLQITSVSGTGTAFWSDSSSNVLSCTDPKLFLYLTLSNLNAIINLREIDSSGKTVTPANYLNLDLSNYYDPSNAASAYDVLLILSRTTTTSGNTYGSNFLWISITNHYSEETLVEGYLKLDNLYTKTYDSAEINKRFTIESVSFCNTNLSKFNLYSRYQDFSKRVISSVPNDSGYKYGVAHITIRSVESKDVLDEIKNQLLENELIWVQDVYKLYIKTNGAVKVIGNSGGSSTNTDDTMTTDDLIKALTGMGLIYTSDTGEWEMSKLSGVTFINEDTGKTFDITVDAHGNLNSTETPKSSSFLANRVTTSKLNLDKNERTYRGFIGILNKSEQTSLQASGADTKNYGTYSDRLKIGAFYAPKNTFTSFGCSHAYIELENTSDLDINLKGCYLSFVHPNGSGGYRVDSLELTGVIPKGSTYLIRGKEYSKIGSSPSTFINVSTYDQEWYIDGSLVDLSIEGSYAYGFLLTYGNTLITSDDEWETATLVTIPSTQTNTKGASEIHICESNEDTSTKDNAPWIYVPNYIDSLYYNNYLADDSNFNYWTCESKVYMTCLDDPNRDVIYKNSFELDPANQAYQALNLYDSSRYRHKSADNEKGGDYYYIPLDKEYIEFPKSSEKYPVSKFTPKASFEGKNVSTDKSKMDMDKPNMVTCSFGIDIYKTRCFNWVSAGLFDEYVFIENGNTWNRFESYKTVDSENTQDTTSYPSRKEFGVNVNNIIYSRITNRFPADNTLYTSHKCIIDIVNTNVTSPTTYTYKVGRADKNGNPDPDHTSEEMTFTLYPNTYTPKIYQITDQQGFHWVEYQVWAAAANKINETIDEEKLVSNIIPILINTGDMTQSGSRISEWLDYYNAGLPLFNHLEQMNVVGNNDLCGTDVTKLGTGNDAGKSNSYYFHVFYCYEISEGTGLTPIVNNKYVPSIYYFDSKDYRFLMVNSELTVETCDKWFNIHTGDLVTNIYTGFGVSLSTSSYDNTITPVYTMLYNMTDTTKSIIAACHEMPFTVITNECLAVTESSKNRSINEKGKLVGSHLNQISENDGHALHWFSRLLEYRKVKLCLGGHKHTYSCTYQLRENYSYNDTKTSKVDGPMTMSNTLSGDTASFSSSNVFSSATGKPTANLSKFPLTLGNGSTLEEQLTSTSSIIPTDKVESFVNFNGWTGGVTYFMCQATGFKLFSNKELPAPTQKFSKYIPESSYNTKKNTWSASSEQRYPMFAEITLGTNYTIKLIRMRNIQKAANLLFYPTRYGTDEIVYQYLRDNSDAYGTWTDSDTDLITI